MAGFEFKTGIPILQLRKQAPGLPPFPWSHRNGLGYSRIMVKNTDSEDGLGSNPGSPLLGSHVILAKITSVLCGSLSFSIKWG